MCGAPKDLLKHNLDPKSMQNNLVAQVVKKGLVSHSHLGSRKDPIVVVLRSYKSRILEMDPFIWYMHTCIFFHTHTYRHLMFGYFAPLGTDPTYPRR